MEKIGYVISEQAGKVVLDLRRTGSCGDKCATCQSHCDVPSVQVTLDNTLMAKKGDFVEVGMNPRNLIRSTFIIYTIPLIMFILGMTVSLTLYERAGIASAEMYGILTGFAVLALTFVAIRLLTERREQSKPSILKMNKIL